MTYRRFDKDDRYYVGVHDGFTWITHEFLDVESQTLFCVALDNSVGTVEE